MVQEYSPKIIGFFCRWCSYTGADLAGSHAPAISSEHQDHHGALHRAD